MPGRVAGILRRLVENQSTVDQNISTQDVFNRIQHGLMSYQAMGPIEKQVETVESFRRTFFTAINKRVERATKKGNLVIEQHSNRKYNAIAVVLSELLF